VNEYSLQVEELPGNNQDELFSYLKEKFQGIAEVAIDGSNITFRSDEEEFFSKRLIRFFTRKYFHRSGLKNECKIVSLGKPFYRILYRPFEVEVEEEEKEKEKEKIEEEKKELLIPSEKGEIIEEEALEEEIEEMMEEEELEEEEEALEEEIEEMMEEEEEG